MEQHLQYVRLAIQAPGGVFTLHRPERLNTIGTGLLADFHPALATTQADTNTGAIALTGAGDDLKEFSEQAPRLLAVS